MARTENEILSELIARLNFHVNTPGASIHQHNYKGDLFELCAEAYDSGYFEPNSTIRFTGQALNDRLSERWVKGNDDRQNLLDSFLPIWDEWHYVLEKRR